MAGGLTVSQKAETKRLQSVRDKAMHVARQAAIAAGSSFDKQAFIADYLNAHPHLSPASFSHHVNVAASPIGQYRGEESPTAAGAEPTQPTAASSVDEKKRLLKEKRAAAKAAKKETANDSASDGELQSKKQEQSAKRDPRSAWRSLCALRTCALTLTNTRADFLLPPPPSPQAPTMAAILAPPPAVATPAPGKNPGVQTDEMRKAQSLKDKANHAARKKERDDDGGESAEKGGTAAAKKQERFEAWKAAKAEKVRRK